MTRKERKTVVRRLREVTGEVLVPVVLTNFTADVDQQLSKLARAYFTGCRKKLDLLPGAKVVARLEVRRLGHYLDVSLAETGEDGKVHWHAARHHLLKDRLKPRRRG